MPNVPSVNLGNIIGSIEEHQRALDKLENSLDRLKIDIHAVTANIAVENESLRPSSPSRSQSELELGPTPLEAETEVQELMGLLNNDEDIVGDTRETFFEVLGRNLRHLLKEERKSKTPSIKRLFELAALSDYNVLRENLRIQGCSTPNTTAAEEIAKCKAANMLGENARQKGEWYARRLRAKAHHVAQFGCLPISGQGKGATHYSLLCNDEVKLKILAYLRSLQVGQVRISKVLQLETRNLTHNMGKSVRFIFDER